MPRYEGRHRHSAPSALERGKVILPTTAIVVGAVAVGAVSTASGATVGSASLQLRTQTVTDAAATRALSQGVSRFESRASLAVDASVKAATEARAKAHTAAVSRAHTLRDAARKKAVLAALSAATPAQDHVVATPGSTAASTASAASDTSGGYVCPIAGCGGVFTSGYGYRISPGGIGSTLHGGIDLSTPIGTPLRAMRSGTVVEAGWWGGCGMRIIIDYGNGVSTWYCHMSGFAVGTGEQVGIGQVVGWSGNSGASTGPHLHLEVHLGGQRVDPYPWLAARGLI